MKFIYGNPRGKGSLLLTVYTKYGLALFSEK
jgi:hypothetical protein